MKTNKCKLDTTSRHFHAIMAPKTVEFDDLHTRYCDAMKRLRKSKKMRESAKKTIVPKLNEINASTKDAEKTGLNLVELKRQYEQARQPLDKLKEEAKTHKKETTKLFDKMHNAVAFSTKSPDVPTINTEKRGTPISITPSRWGSQLTMAMFELAQHTGNWKGIRGAKVAADFLKSRGVYAEYVTDCGSESNAMKQLCR